MEGVTAGIAAEQIVKDFKASNIPYGLAVRLTGKFKEQRLSPTGRPNPPRTTRGDTNDQSKEPQLKRFKSGRRRHSCGGQRYA